jgi:hypothetical protein
VESPIVALDALGDAPVTTPDPGAGTSGDPLPPGQDTDNPKKKSFKWPSKKKSFKWPSKKAKK